MWPIFTQYLFSRFGIDFVGPLNETLGGNKFILVMTEYYTMFNLIFNIMIYVWPVIKCSGSFKS